MNFTLYTDFTSAECHALNEHVARLGVEARVNWRGVQHDPGLPVPMRLLDRRALNELEDVIEDVRRLSPGLEIALPLGKPNTSAAIVAVASVMRLHPVRAAAFRDGLYRAYWREGTDLSVMAELQRVADAAGVPRFVGLDHPDVEETVVEWELDWATERLGGVPRVIRSDGRILWGLRSADEISAFFLRG